jgi:NADPH-dependent 2,4-dienoyl-CoA reductase/sulfur reductase-like enzyme
VLVVGAGAAGMSCADGLAKHPDKFDVTIIGESRCPRVARDHERAMEGQRKGDRRKGDRGVKEEDRPASIVGDRRR